MPKIAFEDYLRMLRDPDTLDNEILAYSVVIKGEGGAFAPELAPDPAKVEMTLDDMEAESAMKLGNGFSRWRRQARFRRRIDKDGHLPVLVSEGDSWFQFPLLISEIVDQLGDEFLIWSTGAAGDTARNMVIDNPEYMKALRKHKDHVQGFLFSAAGNDVIGEDPDTGRAALLDLLKDFNGNTNDVVGHVNLAALGETLAFLHSAYSEVIETVRAERGFGALPIFIHGYDYAFPYPWRNNDKRNPVYAANDGWLGQPLAAHGIVDDGLRRKIIMFMIDALYDMLATLAGNSQASGVWVVNCRGAMPRLSDWADEIHGTSAGFAKVAARFRPVIRSAI